MKKEGLRLSDFHNVDTLTDSYLSYVSDIDKKKINIGFLLLNEQNNTKKSISMLKP